MYLNSLDYRKSLLLSNDFEEKSTNNSHKMSKKIQNADSQLKVSSSETSLPSAFIKNTSYLLVVKWIGRLLTFTIHHVLLHYSLISPQIYGITHVHFEFVYNSIIFLGREALRLTATRKENQTSVSITERLTTLGSIALPMGILASLLIYGIFVYPHQVIYQGVFSSYRFSLVLYIISAYLELSTEPVFLLIQQAYRLDIRMNIEFVATIFRSILILVLLISYQHRYHDSLLPFAYGQLLQSLITWAAYHVVGILGFIDHVHYTPTTMIKWIGGTKITSSSKHYLKLFILQSLIKQALNENDRITLSYLSSFYDQGMYSLISVYGSLVIRLVFQPLEESSRILFSKMDSRHHQTVEQVAYIVRLVTYLGCMFAAFGTNYAYVVCEWLIGIDTTWNKTMASHLLSIYCIYILVLGINGMIEAYLFATAGKYEISLINYSMLLMSVFYYAISFLCVRHWGTAGLLYANILVMIGRIFYSAWLLNRYQNVSWTSLRTFLPSPIVMGCFILSGGLCYVLAPSPSTLQQITSKALIQHVAWGLLLSVMMCFLLYHQERSVWKKMMAMMTTYRASDR
jgi:oligosaccharide translocation protein RFT1